MKNETTPAAAITMTEETEKLFTELVNDAANWSGMPLWDGNVSGGKERRGNLTNLKRLGLVKPQTDEGCTWVCFTAAGNKLAAEMDLDAPTIWAD